MINELKNLTEITLIHKNVSLDFYLKHEIIIQIIDTHQKLMKLNLLKFYLKEKDLNQLQKALSKLEYGRREWKFVDGKDELNDHYYF